jgi:hypothetical protein
MSASLKTGFSIEFRKCTRRIKLLHSPGISATYSGFSPTETFTQEIKFKTLTLVYKMKMGRLPDYLSPNMVTVAQTHGHKMSRRTSFRLPNYPKTSTQNTAFYRELPTEFKNRCRSHVMLNFDKHFVTIHILYLVQYILYYYSPY